MKADTASPRRSQQRRALGLSTLAFTLCFAVWTIFSIIGVRLKQELGLSDTQLGLLMATPVLTGSVSRLVLGIWTDRFGGRWVFGLLMLTSSACVYLVTFATTYALLLLAALGIGLAGGSFIVGVSYVSAWYEREQQGTALGIFGAGNVGAAITSFVAPSLMVALGWQGTALVYATVLSAMGVAFMVLAGNDPMRAVQAQKRTTLKVQLAPLADLRVWRFSLYYFCTFGSFVALAMWLPLYLMNVYGLGLTAAGMVATLFSVPAALFRILGGVLSDRIGARRVMYWTLGVGAICTFLLSYPPTQYSVSGVHGTLEFSLAVNLPVFILLILVLGFFLSLGMAAVFKHIPVYYPTHVGAVGGVVGMVGGLGGFFLPLTFGMLNDVVGIWQSCFMLMLIIIVAALLWMHLAIRRQERREWAANTRGVDLPELLRPGHFVLDEWHPEDETFWRQRGARIARRNLWISIPNLLLAFAVWSIWSILVVRLPQLGFSYTPNQLFWLAALPSLSGATLRIFYSFMVPIFGGRRWTAISTASLLLPCLWIGVAVQHPNTPYSVMLILALLCGFGGGNFASSMANISFFYPQAQKGTAMGLNAGLGNLGVSVLQLIGPLVIAAGVLGPAAGEPLIAQQGAYAGEPVWIQNIAFIWVPLIALAAIAAWFGMNDIASAKSSFRDQAVIFKRLHNWLMSWLYLGTFGSFIGFAAGFPLLSNMQFPDIDPTRYAFLGPLVGALARPLGGWLSDRLGGARVTLWNFALMAVGVTGVLLFLPEHGEGGSFVGFFVMFMVLFVATGIGNGSTYRMVPVIFFNQRRQALGEDHLDEARVQANRESAAVLGFISAIAAYGGFFIPKSYGTATAMTGSVAPALYGFIFFYLSCMALTWWYYARRNAPAPC
ncbi:nitrate/nitrite transporter [Kushneria phosphatilytica]|uniref:MFS transporter n=1 Tax=Kushneria phosphatilytica TaxID=657387 RepID=A0A1S1NM66_9GAMM|nr:MFS transporter [Kushneria phosphatilytica]OHV07831.1 MFS transporter [Kushneria phosphatilytica]QEL10078.1 MFS transporter [Kushneria phosphatilytica]